jgi:hypothetical protein
LQMFVLGHGRLLEKSPLPSRGEVPARVDTSKPFALLAARFCVG